MKNENHEIEKQRERERAVNDEVWSKLMVCMAFEVEAILDMHV